MVTLSPEQANAVFQPSRFQRYGIFGLQIAFGAGFVGLFWWIRSQLDQKIATESAQIEKSITFEEAVSEIIEASQKTEAQPPVTQVLRQPRVFQVMGRVGLLTLCSFATYRAICYALRTVLNEAAKGNAFAKALLPRPLLTAFGKRIGINNSIDSIGSSPLLVAANFGQLDLALTLLQCGADPTTSNQFGWSFLHAVAQQGWSQVLRLVHEEIRKGTLRINATAIIPNGAENGMKMQSGTPLMVVPPGDAGDLTFYALLDMGADPSMRKFWLDTPSATVLSDVLRSRHAKRFWAVVQAAEQQNVIMSVTKDDLQRASEWSPDVSQRIQSMYQASDHTNVE